MESGVVEYDRVVCLDQSGGLVLAVTFAQVEPSIDLFLNYGSMGLLALIVFWAMWRFLPAALQTHREIITKVAEDHKSAVIQLAEAFTTESNECREERRETVRVLAELQRAVLDLQKK